MGNSIVLLSLNSSNIASDSEQDVEEKSEVSGQNDGKKCVVSGKEEKKENYNVFGHSLPRRVVEEIFGRLDALTFLQTLPLISLGFKKLCHDMPISVFRLVDIDSSAGLVSRFFSLTKKCILEPPPYDQLLKFPPGYPLTKGLYRFVNTRDRGKLQVSLINSAEKMNVSQGSKRVFTRSQLNLLNGDELSRNIWVVPMTKAERRENTQPLLIGRPDGLPKELYFRRNMSMLPDKTSIDEKLLIDVFTSECGTSFKQDEVYSMNIHSSNLLDPPTYALGFETISRITFFSLRILRLKRIILVEDALDFIGRHVLDLLLLDHCPIVERSLDLRQKFLHLKRLHIILELTDDRDIFVPKEIEELVIQCPGSTESAKIIVHSCPKYGAKAKKHILLVHLENCTRLKSM
jgi:hypothetical protein